MRDDELLFNGLDVTMSKNTYDLLVHYKDDYVRDVIVKDKKIKDLQQRIDKAIDILGKYRHYTTPTEEQNSKNEDYVDNALEILKGDSNEN